MLKKSRKKVGKPTGEKTKSGRPIYIDDDTGERRSEYSSTIQLDNGKWINIPSIHNGHYYSDKELKEAVEDNRMIPTSEHKSEKEALLAAKKRSKTLKQGGLLKAHQGTIVNGQIVYNEPDTEPVEAPQVNRDIGITRPRNITVPTEQPVTDTAPAPTPIAPVPAPAPVAAPFVPPRSDPAPVNQPVPTEQPVTDTAPPPVAATPLPATPDVTGTVEPAVMPRGGPTVEPAIDEITVDDDGIVAAEPTQTMPDNDMGTVTAQPLFPRRNLIDMEYDARMPFTTVMPMPRTQPFMPMPRTQPYRPSPYNPFPSRNPFIRRPMPYNPYSQFPRRGLPRDHDLRPMPIMDRRLSDLINNANRRASRGGLKPNTMPGFLNDMMQTLVKNNNTYKPRGFGNSIGRPMRYNEGGAVMEDQMEMNFGDTPIAQLAEGGMKDDGGKKDPVSGNDVPIGSLDQEVRDDVPAMVSEGEFIFPADVTRYIGLDQLMQLRQDAKMGLKKMEMMGQLGNPEDAVLPDDIPFDAADIIIVDDEMEADEEDIEEDKKYQGGVTGFQRGTADPSQSYYSITEEANKPYNKKYVVYQNDAGKTVLVLSTFNGDPLESVPAGYKIVLNPDGSPATQIPERKDKKDDDKDKDEDTSVQQKKYDDDKDEKLAAILATADKAAKTTADRLGMEVKDYLALPMKTRFNLIGEELKVMRGEKLDITKRDAIIDGAAGDNIFGGGLLGGVIDTIGSIFDKDNDGSMWTSTDKDGNVRNIFGQIIQTGVDVSKMGILKDGRWTGAATVKKTKRSGTGDLTQNLSSSTSSKFDAAKSFKDGKPQTAKGQKADSDRYSAMAKSYQTNKQDKGDGTDTPSTVSSSSSSPTYTSDSEFDSAPPSATYTSDSEFDSAPSNKSTNEYEDETGAGMMNKGRLVTKRTKKKQPTKRKTLLKKRS